MAKEIKQKIVLEGEKQYNQAIKEAQRNLRTLKSELKAETAELGRNATEQQKAEARAKSLKQQIAEQEKIVKTLKEALAQAKEQYGDNADVVQSWEQKLNNARTTLANMKNDLDGVGTSMKNAAQDAAMGTVATKSFADSIGKIADAGSAVSDKLESIFTGMVSLVKESIGAVWTDLMDLAARANQWGDIAGIWNTDAANVEKWSRAAGAATGDFNTLLSAVQKINDLNDDQQKKITDWTNISGVNYEDRWEYATKVLEALNKIGAEKGYNEQLKAVEEIFGAKRGGGVMDLLNDWKGIQEALGRFDAENGGLGLTNEQLEQMNELDIKVHTLQETWHAFIDEFEATHLAQLGLDLTGNAQVILDDLIKYLDSGDESDLEQLEKDIEAFFNRIQKALENAAGKLDEAGKKLQESDNGIVRLIGKAMSDLATALEWLSKDENIDKVVHGFEVLAGFWLAGKGVSLIGRLASFAANLKVISSFNSAGAAAGAASGASSAITSLGSGIASALAGITLTVSVAALAVPVVSALKSLIVDGKWPDYLPDPTKTSGEILAPNASKEDQQAITEAVNAGAPVSRKDALQWAVGKLTGQGRSKEEIKEEQLDPWANLPQANLGPSEGPSSPVRTARIDATPAQQAAAEAFWDVFRSGDWGENDEKFDAAWDAMEQAFQGNEGAFERLDSLLDKLIEEHSAAQHDKDYRPESWMDIPASWWQTPAGSAGGNGVTSQDLAGFRGLPAGMQAAVQRGAAAGISGIRVSLDGRTVGELVAPYVSAAIARDIG